MFNLNRQDILYEDLEMLVVRKCAGMAVQHGKIGQMDLEHQILNYLAEGSGGERSMPYLGIIHRLDQPVEGILVFAKTPGTASRLNGQMRKNNMLKEYLAVVEESGALEEAVLVDYLWKDNCLNTSRIINASFPGAKRSELAYRVLARRRSRALVCIRLKTGRHHQIRVQMSNAGMPLCGDRKYNAQACAEEQLALCAFHLSFSHPLTGKRMDFQIEPENPIFGPFFKHAFTVPSTG